LAQQGSGKKRKSAGTDRAAGASRQGSGAKPAGSSSAGKTPPRTAVQYGPSGSALSKRAEGTGKAAPQTNRTQLLIGGAALVLILGVIIGGIVLNRANTAIRNDGYGNSRNGTASTTDFVINLSAGSAPVTVDIYEDALCPFCGQFERQYGQLIAQYVDEKKIDVNYHLMNFLDSKSTSGTYSTRAAGAMFCTAEHLGDTPKVWSDFHGTLFSEDVQPKEDQSGDLSDDQLNERISTAATSNGVAANSPGLAAATACVSGGEKKETVQQSYDASEATLTTLLGGVQSPVVVSGGTVLDIDNGNWLSDLVGS
jgi:protein-disulfide isomerase